MELKNIFYITINKINGHFYFGVHRTNPEVFDGYIGCGIWSDATADEDFALHKAVRKYGYKNFKRTTIAVFSGSEEGRKEALKLEKTIVNQTLLRSHDCYNMTPGGGGCVNNDKINKRVYMFTLKGEYLRSFKSSRDACLYLINEKKLKIDVENIRHGIRNVCLGTAMSSCGYYWSYKKEFLYKENEICVKVAQYTISGKFLRYFDSISEAENNFKCCISQALATGGVSGGYQWRRYTGDDSDISFKYNLTTKNTDFPIIMFKNGKKVGEYSSVNNCVEQNPKLQASQINRVLKGKIKTHFGYSFKLKDEDIV